MLMSPDYLNDFQREYLNSLFNLLYELNKSSKKAKNYDLSLCIEYLIDEIVKLRGLIALKGGPSKYGGGSFIIDLKEDQ